MVICDVTLKVKHLPASLSTEEKEEFLRHFGAIHVKVITSFRKQVSVVYGKFENKHTAKAVLHRIHQLKVLDSILCVEYAEKKIADSLILSDIETTKKLSSEVSTKEHYINYVTKINALNSAVGFDQPPLPHLHYVYPKANPGTINNISFALDTVPQFYYQVLHLMNRMNLPPPFSNPTESIRVTNNVRQQKLLKQSDSESELESDPEDNCQNFNNVIPQKRVKAQSKVIKRPKFIKPLPMPTKVPSEGRMESKDVFEKVEIQQRRPIQLNLSLDEILNTSTPKVAVDSENNVEALVEDNSKDQEPKESVITEERLSENRMDIKSLSVLPVFKSYHPGAPNNKLYIKNIAKSVEMSDLEFIYKRYEDKTQNSETEIKHMTEGRMKGQAFVTLPSVELAQKALKETNGYILKDKPLVVVFAKINAQKN